MSQPDIGDYKDLVNANLKNSEEDLRDAGANLQRKAFRCADNRLYYALFHAVLAVLIADGTKVKSHKEALGQFNKLYIKTEVFPKELGKLISSANLARTRSDYEPTEPVQPQRTNENYTGISKYIPVLKEYCAKKLRNNTRTKNS